MVLEKNAKLVAHSYCTKYGLWGSLPVEVTVAEVGDIKRDLAFLGDTMNTAARIEGQCNIYNKNLLISALNGIESSD